MARRLATALSLDDSSLTLARRLWHGWLGKHRQRLGLVIALMLVMSLTTGAYPLVIDWAFTLFEAEDAASVFLIPEVILFITILKGGSQYLQAVIMQSVVLRVIADLQRAMFAKLISSDFADLAGEAPGRHAARFTHDMTAIREGLNKVVNGAADILTVAALLASMIWLDWALSLVVLVVYPAAALPVVALSRRMRAMSGGVQAHVGDMTALVSESLGGARLVKTYGLEGYETERAARSFETHYGWMMRMTRGRAAVDPILEVLGGVAVGGVLAFAGWRAITGDATIGTFTGFVGALLLAARPVRSIGTLNVVLQEGLSALARVFAVIDQPRAIVDRPHARALPAGPGRVELKDVRFRYGDNDPALTHCSIVAEPGKTTALVGPSGAGKSTVLSLIPRLYDVEAGAVLVDGQDVRDVTLESLRAVEAVVSQDVVLFNNTVRANIAFGKLDASDEEVVRAATAAGAHDFVLGLPQGYATPVGEGGGRLSGGQRQRIALARALLRNPRILLLDEATNALDAESEARVQMALDKLRQGRTTIVIAHRLQTVRSADRIYVMEGGRPVEMGTHAELIASDGLYARMCRTQAFLDSPTRFLPDPVVEDVPLPHTNPIQRFFQRLFGRR